jgi:hypothetical protein
MFGCLTCGKLTTIEIQGDPLCDICAADGCIYLQKTIIQLLRERDASKLLEAVEEMSMGVFSKTLVEFLDVCFQK